MVRYERIVNNSAAPTTLNSTISASATAIAVGDGTLFPSEGDFRVLIDSEVLLITARSGNVLTAIRGQDNTTAASHNGGTAVNAILTQEGLDAYFNQVLGHSSSRQAARLLDKNGATLTSSDFTFDNQGSAAMDDVSDGSIALRSDDTDISGARLHVVWKSAPSAPWKVTACFQFGLGCAYVPLGSGTTAGLLCRENSTGEFIITTMHGGNDYGANRWTSPTVFSAAVAGVLTPDSDSPLFWCQIEDNNTNLFWRVSHDGINFHEIATEGRTAFMAGGPDNLGFALSERALGAATPRHILHLRSWLEE